MLCDAICDAGEQINCLKLLEILDFGLALASRQPAPRLTYSRLSPKHPENWCDFRGSKFFFLRIRPPHTQHRCIFLFIIKNNAL